MVNLIIHRSVLHGTSVTPQPRRLRGVGHRLVTDVPQELFRNTH
jgi:hypothetical protein